MRSSGPSEVEQEINDLNIRRYPGRSPPRVAEANRPEPASGFFDNVPLNQRATGVVGTRLAP